MQRGAEVQLGAQIPVSPANYISAGLLEPIDAAHAGDNQMTIKVASNAPLRLLASASAPLSDIRVDVVSVGQNAVLSGQMSTVTTGFLAGETQEIFRTGGKTARTRGPAESQSIALQISWTGEAAPAINIAALD